MNCKLLNKVIKKIWKENPNVKIQDYDSKGLLDVILHYYHPESGLLSEGVYHNCLMGMVYLRMHDCLEHGLLEEENRIYLKEAKKLGASVYELNYSDERNLFRQRTFSKFWNHEKMTELYTYETKHFLTENLSMRLLPNCLALMFYKELQAVTAKDFVDIEIFWNAIKMSFLKTVGNQFFVNSWDDGQSKHFRAVDHAIMMRTAYLMKDFRIAEELQSVLTTHFQIGKKTWCNYIDKETKKRVLLKDFVWQDAWILICLIQTDADKELIKTVLELIIEKYYYEERGIFVNEPLTRKRSSWGTKLLAFNGDNALMFKAISLMPDELLNEKAREFKETFMTDQLKILESNDYEIHELDSHLRSYQPTAIWTVTEFLFGMISMNQIKS